MNTAVTSREAILTVCRELVSRQGLDSLNMRSVARACQVALGSLYNYFPSKDDLLLATVESVWQDIFHMDGLPDQDLSFPGCVQMPSSPCFTPAWAVLWPWQGCCSGEPASAIPRTRRPFPEKTPFVRRAPAGKGRFCFLVSGRAPLPI